MINLYIKRNTQDINSEFSIFDKLGNQKYFVLSEKNPIHRVFRITNSEKNSLSKILKNNFINNKFLILYNKQRLLLSHSITLSNCDLYIYGMPWCITGNALSGNYAVIDVDNSVIMTHKKIWYNNFSYSRVEISNSSFEIPALSLAVCMNLYISISEKEKSSVPNI